MSEPPRRVCVAPGPGFSGPASRRRPRIAGSSWDDAAVADAFRRALGDEVAMVSKERPLVVDADACSLDGRPLLHDSDWKQVVEEEGLARVDGAFALAHRGPNGKISLARDPIGHRSLYYTVLNDRLFFASSLRALLDASHAPRRLCLHAVALFLACAYVPGRETMVDGAFEVLPGEIVSFDNGTLRRNMFWDLPHEPAQFEPEAQLRARLRDELERTIQSFLPHGEPVAASLSGGIDSSLVVALAQRLHDRPVQTFAITFGAQYKDELPWSSLVATHCGTNHTIVELTPGAIAAHLDDTIRCLDKPNGDPLTVPNALLFREMATHAAVALNGEGGDPCFGGPKNVPMVLAELYGHHEEDDSDRTRRQNYLRAHQKCFDELSDLLAPDVWAAACPHPLEDDLVEWFGDPRWTTLVTRLMAINVRFKGGHHILPKVDALSAPFGIVARSPLFHRTVVELAFSIPPEHKLRGAIEKHLLKDAVADLLPRAILDRPKSGMLVPVEGWFQGPLLADARSRILDGLVAYGLFRRRYLEDLLDGKLGGLRPRRGVKIWLLITLESHLRALKVATDVGSFST